MNTQSNNNTNDHMQMYNNMHSGARGGMLMQQQGLLGNSPYSQSLSKGSRIGFIRKVYSILCA